MKNYLSAFLAAVLMGSALNSRAQTAPYANTGPFALAPAGVAYASQVFGPPGGAYALTQLSGYTDYGLTTNYGLTSGSFTAFQGCLDFNYNIGQGLYSTVATAAFNSDYTIEAWVYNEGNSPYETIFATSSGTPNTGPVLNNELRLSLNYGVPTFDVWDSDNRYHSQVVASAPVPGGQWVHLAVVMTLTYNPENSPNLETVIYQNGQPVGSQLISYEDRSVNNRYMFIGRGVWDTLSSPGDGGYPFSGYIGEVRVWATNLTQTTIQQWMNQTITPSHPNYANLGDYYQFVSSSFAGYDNEVGFNGLFTGGPNWQSFGPPIAIHDSQPISPLLAGQLYHYRARLNSGSAVLATGADATLTTPGPQLNPIPNIFISKDSANTPVQISGIQDVGAMIAPVVATASSSNPSVVLTPTVSYTSPNTTGTVYLTAAPNTLGSSLITVQVVDSDSGSLNLTNSQTFMVTVTNLPPVVGPGTSINLNGNGQFVDVPSKIWFNNQFTTEAWVYPRTNTAGTKLFDFANIPGQDNVTGLLYGPAGGPRLMIYPTNTGTGILDSSTPLPANQWSHVAFTRDSSGLGHIYVNGIQVASAAIRTPVATTRINSFIGRGNGATDPFFNGKISDFRIWNTALTAQQLTNDWSAALPEPASQLALDYHFSEGSGYRAYDSSQGLHNPLRTSQNDGLLSAKMTNYVATGVGPDYGISLPGDGSYIKLPSATWINGDYTFETWVYVRSYNAWERAFDIGNGGYVNNAYLALSAGAGGYPTMSSFSPGTTGPLVTSSSQIPLNQWVHLAATQQGTTGTIYMNGVQVASGTLGTMVNTVRTNCYIGRSAFSQDGYANAIFNEARIWTGARSQAQVQADMSQNLTGTESGLVGYWRFDEPTGPYVADLSPNGYTATLVGNAQHVIITNNVPAHYGPESAHGYALSFNGTASNDVTIPNEGGYSSTPLTVIAWVNAVQPSTMQDIVSLSSAIGNVGWDIVGETSGRIGVYYNPGAQASLGLTDIGRIADGQWHEVAFTVDPTNGFAAYLDGALKAQVQGAITAVPFTNSLQFGRNYAGLLDNVSIWNAALSPAQIAASFTNRFVGNEQNLAGYWTFDEGVGNTAIDLSPAGNNGSLNWQVGYVARTNGLETNAPLGNDMVLTINENTTTQIYLPGTDIDSTLQWAAATDTNAVFPGTLSVAPNDGIMTYLPAPNYVGPAAVQYSATDGLLSNGSSIHLYVQHVPQPPSVAELGLNFDGTNNVVVITNIAEALPTTEVTVEFWEKVKQPVQQFAFGLASDYQSNSFDAYAPDIGGAYGTIYWDFGNINNGGRLTYQLPSDISAKWTHFAMVSSQSGSYMKLYINGVLAAQTSRASSYTPSPGALLIGPPPFAGAISEFRIWNTARNSTNILSDMVSPLVGNEPGLVAYYRMSEGSGVTVVDSATALNPSYNGIIMGGSPYPAWVSGPTNFEVFQAISFSSNNPIYLPAFDPDSPSSSLTWTITGNSNLHGTLTQISGGRWLYTPDPFFSGGLVSFTYTVSDGVLSNSVTVYINVAQINPPVLSPFPNQLTPQDTATPPIPFTLTDSSTPVNQLTLSVVSDNETVFSTNYTLTLNGTNGLLTLKPNPGQIGFATVTVTASDGRNTTSSSFVFQVAQNPVYTIVDLGVLPNRFASYGTGINNQGQIVGYSTDGSVNQNQKLPFFYTGFAASGQLIGLNGFSSGSATAINGQGQITGVFSTPNGSQHAYFYDPFGAATAVDFGALGTNAGVSSSSGFGINDSGIVVGQSSTSYANQLHAFVSGASLRDLGFGSPSAATGINDVGQIIGYVVSGQTTNGFIITPGSTNSPGSTNFFSVLPGGANIMPSFINQFGDVVGVGDVTGGATHAFFQAANVGPVTDIGVLPGFANSRAFGLNAFRQVVGASTDAGGTSHAILYATGKLYDINNLLPYEETNGWILNEARGINDQGEIVGTGKTNGHVHAFLALPARPIGLPIPRPLGTVAALPAIDIIDPVRPDDSASTAFFWSPPDQQLYAIRPVTATIHWQAAPGSDVSLSSTNAGGAVTVDVTSKSVWPRQAQTDVVGTPVQVIPQGLPSNVNFPYAFQSLLFSTIVGVDVDPSSQVFDPQSTGYTVLRYLVITPGLPIDPINSYSHFEVVRSVAWNDPNYLTDNVTATIGTAITNSTHFDYDGRNGYVYFQKSVYDGLPTDPNRAYDLPTRQGPIIPVNLINKNLAVPDDDLVVVWYHTNSIGVAWADSPYRYVPVWPTNADSIVIASQLGSGPLDPTVINNPLVYTQNDPTQPGFNPNEEHALIVANTVYALRNDLNSYFGNLSQPYTLLKYTDDSGNWQMHVYKVLATNSQYQFVYSATAGTQINPPLPLSIMQLCPENNNGVSGPYYKAQADGSLWARAAGTFGGTTNLVIHYWYPMQPSFYYGGNAQPGDCIPWLDQGISNPPVDVTYVVSWPSSSVYLEVGQTLTTPVNGLPDITDQLAAKIVYDDLNPYGVETDTNLARLYDPISPRTLPVSPTASWLSTLKLQNVNGVEQFSDLPYFLRIRLTYDPINSAISFSGINAPTTPGGPLVLMPNVMSERELHDIRSLDGDTGTSDFDNLITSLYNLTRNPNQLTLNPVGIGQSNYDKTLLIGLTVATNTNGSLSIVPEQFGSGPKALTTGLAGVPPALPTTPGGTNYPPRYVTVVVDDPTTPGSVVSMYVIQIANGPYGGSLAVMPGDNAFDQRLTLRYSDDFGGDPGSLQFQWYYFPGDNGGVAPPNPLTDANGNITNINNWLVYSVADVPNTDLTNGLGAHYITLGEGGESGLLTMSDNWFVGRYRGYGINGQTNWSDWVGQPGGDQAQFAEGWINRVLAALNPFEARSADFHTSPIDTYQSMLEQAGARYEGPIALNSDPNYLNSVGLIQAYQTVLERGESLSINGSPPVNYQPANQSLQNAASDISDLYVVLGNEAYAEAADPTVGFDTGSTFGSLASSLFAFEDQVDTLLDQELDLLRGRDDSATTVQAPPVYNRLYWNFTGGNGEVAYVQTFDITDVNGDGFINAADAQIMFPQGHGDAWGHYLTSLTVYYDLLRNTNFNWVPRAEAVSLGGVAVQVNYEDEQKFAHAAAQKALTGSQIAALTYSSAYVDNPAGQYQGYEDTDTNRAWGLSEWARRAGQGAYFDWVTVNALLPAVDPNPNDSGLSKVDRTTVTDIQSIPAAAATLQSQLDEADAGLNPLGLAKNAVPFDIDPTLVAEGETHFEQIYGRAVDAMANAVAVWNQANEFTSALREQQDTVNQYTQNVTKQDQAYQDRLIEIFGYPFAGDIGTPSGAYPAGYTGPDLYHYMYIDTSAFDSTVQQPSSVLTAFFTNMPGAGAYFPADLPSTYTQPTNLLNLSFPLADGIHRFQPPVSWGQRQAPGSIQNALSDCLQSQGRLDQAIDNYTALVQQIEDAGTLLQAQYNLQSSNQDVLNTTQNTVIGLSSGIAAAKLTAAGLQAAQNTLANTEDITLSALPNVEGLADDAMGGVRASIKSVGSTESTLLQIGQTAANTAATAMQDAISQVQNQASLTIANNNLGYQIQAQQLALVNLLEQEPGARADCATLRETLAQNIGNYQAALAEGEQVLQQRATFAQQAAAQTETERYSDMTYRIFQNDAIQKYQAQFALAQRYVYLAAMAYDFETELLGSASGSGQEFLTDIISQQSLGEMDNGVPVNGVAGLADPLARLSENFAVLKGQFGFNNPQTETGKFSLRYGLFRQQEDVTNALPINGQYTNDWQTELEKHIVPDLWQVPEFRRYCRPFAPESAGAQPGLVIPFSTTITFGLNFFGWPLSGGDSAYDPTLFATKVRSVGAWFAGYDNSGLSTTPRIYLIPVGADVMRSPTDGLTIREWHVVDQALPVPFPLGVSTEASANYIPIDDSLSGTMDSIRQFSSFLGYTDQSPIIDPTEVTTSTRLIGRSVWNTEWMLIIPGGTLLADPNQGLQTFINSVSDIKIFFQTYAYSGD